MLPVLLKHWRLFGVGALVLAWAVSLALAGAKERSLKGQLSEARATIASQARDLQQCRANTTGLRHAIEAQNSAVEALEAESRMRTAAAEKAASEARKSALDAERRAGAVLAARPGADRCASALDILKGKAG